MQDKVVSVGLSSAHVFSKSPQVGISLLAGRGVEGDAHCGPTVQHRSRVAVNPDQPNLRQVHSIHAELLDELKGQGFDVAPGTLGENALTRGLALLAFPVGTQLHLGATAVVELTGLRNPCAQLDAFREGLTAAVLDRDEEGELIRKAGVMAAVLVEGDVRPGDEVAAILPAQPHYKLERV
jgi:MOSC domain-containing protein YiiM